MHVYQLRWWWQRIVQYMDLLLDNLRRNCTSSVCHMKEIHFPLRKSLPGWIFFSSILYSCNQNKEKSTIKNFEYNFSIYFSSFGFVYINIYIHSIISLLQIYHFIRIVIVFVFVSSYLIYILILWIGVETNSKKNKYKTGQVRLSHGS